MVKKILLTFLVMCVFFVELMAREYSGRGYDPDAPNLLEIFDGNEMIIGLVIAIVAIPIGYAILNIGGKDGNSDGSSFLGCLGVLIIGAGVICVLPLLQLVVTLAYGIYTVVIIAVIVLGIIGFLFSKK